MPETICRAEAQKDNLQSIQADIIRKDIGNARIAGLADDLDLTPSQYRWLLFAFYITYILFEWMTLMYVWPFE